MNAETRVESLASSPESREIVVIVARGASADGSSTASDNGYLTKETVPLDKAGSWYESFRSFQASQHADGIRNAVEIVAVNDGYDTKTGEREISNYFSQFDSRFEEDAR